MKTLDDYIREGEEKLAAKKRKARGGEVPATAVRPGRVKTKWVVRGETFYSKKAAAEHFGVAPLTIARWCKGYTVDGVYRSREKGCYAEEVR